MAPPTIAPITVILTAYLKSFSSELHKRIFEPCGNDPVPHSIFEATPIIVVLFIHLYSMHCKRVTCLCSDVTLSGPPKANLVPTPMNIARRYFPPNTQEYDPPTFVCATSKPGSGLGIYIYEVNCYCILYSCTGWSSDVSKTKHIPGLGWRGASTASDTLCRIR